MNASIKGKCANLKVLAKGKAKSRSPIINARSAANKNALLL